MLNTNRSHERLPSPPPPQAVFPFSRSGLTFSNLLWALAAWQAAYAPGPDWLGEATKQVRVGACVRACACARVRACVCVCVCVLKSTRKTLRKDSVCDAAKRRLTDVT